MPRARSAIGPTATLGCPHQSGSEEYGHASLCARKGRRLDIGCVIPQRPPGLYGRNPVGHRVWSLGVAWTPHENSGQETRQYPDPVPSQSRKGVQSHSKGGGREGSLRTTA